jgi:hypothetical protein
MLRVAVLGLVLLSSLGAGALLPTSPLSALQAQLDALAPGAWHGLAQAPVGERASALLLPGEGVAARVDAAGHLSVEAVPTLPSHIPIPLTNQDATGCLASGGAAAAWEPQPPALYASCDYQVHSGPVSNVFLACLGSVPTFGCAHVGVDYPTDQYFGVLCGYPDGDGTLGLYDPADGYVVQCETFGPAPGSLSSWAVTLSQNYDGTVYGELDP